MNTKEKKEENLLKMFLQAIIPNNPKIVSTILFLVRTFGYGILAHFGLAYLCPFLGC